MVDLSRRELFARLVGAASFAATAGVLELALPRARAKPRDDYWLGYDSALDGEQSKMVVIGTRYRSDSFWDRVGVGNEQWNGSFSDHVVMDEPAQRIDDLTPSQRRNR